MGRKMYGVPVRDADGNTTGQIYVPATNKIYTLDEWNKIASYDSKVSAYESLWLDRYEVMDNVEHSVTDKRKLRAALRTRIDKGPQATPVESPKSARQQTGILTAIGRGLLGRRGKRRTNLPDGWKDKDKDKDD